MKFVGPQKTVNIVGDGYVRTVKAWANGLKLLINEKDDPYAVVFSPLDDEVAAILAVAGIFVSGDVGDVDRFIADLEDRTQIFVSEVSYQ